MVTVITVVHYTACVFLAIIVLLQHGKGADMGATFGGSSQTVFGARGAATFLQKMTAGAAVTFMLTSLTLVWLSSRRTTESLMKPVATPVPTASPVAGAAPESGAEESGTPPAGTTPETRAAAPAEAAAKPGSSESAKKSAPKTPRAEKK